MKTFLTIFCACLASSLFAQQSISGKTVSIKDVPVPYVNIGIVGSKTGAVSDVDGNFSILVPDSLKHDTLTFSSVGFELKKFPIRQLNGGSVKVYLEEKVIALNEIKISKRKRKTYKLGITGRTPMVSVPTSSYQKNDIIEQARLMHLKEPVQVLDANINVLSALTEPVNVRINFYAVENGMPGRRLIEKSIIRTVQQRGWQTFDLRDESIYIDQDFVVAFEYLPGSRKSIAFAAKLGAADSFLRNNSLGIWRKNQLGGPSIYVTVEN